MICNIERFYDIDPAKIGRSIEGAPVVSIVDIYPRDQEFLLILSGARSIKPKYKNFFKRKKTYTREALFYSWLSLLF